MKRCLTILALMMYLPVCSGQQIDSINIYEFYRKHSDTTVDNAGKKEFDECIKGWNFVIKTRNYAPRYKRDSALIEMNVDAVEKKYDSTTAIEFFTGIYAIAWIIGNRPYELRKDTANLFVIRICNKKQYGVSVRWDKAISDWQIRPAKHTWLTKRFFPVIRKGTYIHIAPPN